MKSNYKYLGPAFRIFSLLSFIFFLCLGIRNFKKHPDDNISLFGICYFSGMIAIMLVQMIRRYNDKMENRKKL